jgi:ABC-type spermidine/putrescine transport system permease subunit I
MSFWTGFLVRTYAWLVITGARAPSRAPTRRSGLGRLAPVHGVRLDSRHDPHPAAVHDPALFAIMKKIDVNHLKAAASWGAPGRAFREVFLP